MLSKDPIRIAGPLGRIYSFTRHYQGDDFFEGPRLAFHHDRAYARDHLQRLTRSVADDPFNYRLLDVWQLVFRKPWTRPRNVNQLIADLTDKIHRGELFVYLEPDLERDIPSLLRDGPPEGDGGFVDIGVLGYPADTPRTQDPVFITGNGEPQDAPLTHAVPQGEPTAAVPNNLPATSEVSALGYAVGAAELAAKGVWNGLVEVGAGVSGLGTLLLTGDGAAGAAVVEGVQEKYGAALKTDGAEAIGKAVAPVFEKYEAGKEYLGELGMSQDSPGLATALYTAPDAVVSVVGGFLGRGAINSTKNAGARGLDGSIVPDNIRYEKYWDDLGQTPTSLSNRETRAWYLSKEMEIPNLLDTSKSLEYQAKQAFEIRNDLRAGARDLMADQKAADYLRMNEPNLTWDELVTIKSMKYSGDDLWSSIINSSQKSRESVNTQFNFIGDRPRYD